jgi:hypothetical protein
MDRTWENKKRRQVAKEIREWRVAEQGMRK